MALLGVLSLEERRLAYHGAFPRLGADTCDRPLYSSRHVLVARLTSNGTLAETVGRPLLWSVEFILEGEDTQPHRPSEGFSRALRGLGCRSKLRYLGELSKGQRGLDS